MTERTPQQHDPFLPLPQNGLYPSRFGQEGYIMHVGVVIRGALRETTRTLSTIQLTPATVAGYYTDSFVEVLAKEHPSIEGTLVSGVSVWADGDNGVRVGIQLAKNGDVLTTYATHTDRLVAVKHAVTEGFRQLVRYV